MLGVKCKACIKHHTASGKVAQSLLEIIASKHSDLVPIVPSGPNDTVFFYSQAGFCYTMDKSSALGMPLSLLPLERSRTLPIRSSLKKMKSMIGDDFLGSLYLV
jgi:hypothetical protein